MEGVQGGKVFDSTHEGTKWLIVYGVHICHKQRGQVENLQSALEMVKMVQVPFCHLMSSTGGQDGEVKVVQMTDPEGHRCSKDKTGVILHKFKLKLKERMQSTGKTRIYLHFVYKFGESPMVIVMLNVDD